MEWILYIVGGLFLIGLLSAIGFFTELFTMIFIALFAGVISGSISALFGWGFSGGIWCWSNNWSGSLWNILYNAFM